MFDTHAGRWVLETSCNLNDAPNWEQYTFEQDDALFDFYRDLFFAPADAQEQVEIPPEPQKEGWIWPDGGSLPTL